MTIFNPQRANGTHRAAGTSLHKQHRAIGTSFHKVSRKGNLVKKWLKFVTEFFVFIGFCDEICRFIQLSQIILVSFAVFNARKTQHIVVGKILEDFRYFS